MPVGATGIPGKNAQGFFKSFFVYSVTQPPFSASEVPVPLATFRWAAPTTLTLAKTAFFKLSDS